MECKLLQRREVSVWGERRNASVVAGLVSKYNERGMRDWPQIVKLRPQAPSEGFSRQFKFQWRIKRTPQLISKKNRKSFWVFFSFFVITKFAIANDRVAFRLYRRFTLWGWGRKKIRSVFFLLPWNCSIFLGGALALADNTRRTNGKATYQAILLAPFTSFYEQNLIVIIILPFNRTPTVSWNIRKKNNDWTNN